MARSGRGKTGDGASQMTSPPAGVRRVRRFVRDHAPAIRDALAAIDAHGARGTGTHDIRACVEGWGLDAPWIVDTMPRRPSAVDLA